jgi:methionyl-tRNA synthetase
MLEQTAPWTAIKKGTPEEQQDAKMTLVAALEATRIAAVLLAPVVPGLSSRIFTQLGISEKDQVCIASPPCVSSHQ